MIIKLFENKYSFDDNIVFNEEHSVQSDELYKALLKYTKKSNKSLSVNEFNSIIDYSLQHDFRTVYIGVSLVENKGIPITQFFCDVIREQLDTLFSLAKSNGFRYKLNYQNYNNDTGTFDYSFRLKRKEEFINYRFELNRLGLRERYSYSYRPYIDDSCPYEYLNSLYNFITAKHPTNNCIEYTILDFTRDFIKKEFIL